MTDTATFMDLTLDAAGVHTPEGTMPLTDLVKAGFIRDLDKEDAQSYGGGPSTGAVVGGAVVGGVVAGVPGAIGGALLGGALTDEEPHRGLAGQHRADRLRDEERDLPPPCRARGRACGVRVRAAREEGDEGVAPRSERGHPRPATPTHRLLARVSARRATLRRRSLLSRARPLAPGARCRCALGRSRLPHRSSRAGQEARFRFPPARDTLRRG